METICKDCGGTEFLKDVKGIGHLICKKCNSMWWVCIIKRAIISEAQPVATNGQSPADNKYCCGCLPSVSRSSFIKPAQE